MQGRISQPIENQIQAFPYDEWENEFFKAKKLGYDKIEWVFDKKSNPILFKENIEKIKKICSDSGIGISSICCDYFMTNRLYGVSEKELQENTLVLEKIIENTSQLGMKIVEIPLVDSSSISNKNYEEQFFINLQKILPLVEKEDIILTLETDLEPYRFKTFLERFDNPYVKANYDTGNSTSLGYDVNLELKELGSFIKNIHIKDRIFHGSTVELGTGDCNFDMFFKKLSEIKYEGELIIQGARLDEQEIPEVTCKKYLKFVKDYIDKYLV